MKAFIMSQLSYCSLVWIFHDRHLNNEINGIHERAPRVAYKDNVSSFEHLFLLDNSVTSHQRNLQLLRKQIFEAKVLLFNGGIILEQ